MRVPSSPTWPICRRPSWSFPSATCSREQSLAMAARMAEAGLEVSSKVYPGATHSFLEAMSVARVAREAIADGAAWLGAQFAR